MLTSLLILGVELFQECTVVGVAVLDPLSF